MSKAKDVIRKIKDQNIRTYKRDGNQWEEIGLSDHNYKYIDLTEAQKQFMDSSIGTFEYFLRFNQHIFADPSTSEIIADMVSCFRAECRNGYFHTHNLNDWTVVKKIRDNAIYLYFILLGGCRVPLGKQNDLGIILDDQFDELCKRIREFHNYNSEFIFEYADGQQIKLIYDFINNTVEYNDFGIEHYTKLLFFKVDEFSSRTYEKLDEGIREEQKIYLTRNNLPNKIYGVYRNHQLEELFNYT